MHFPVATLRKWRKFAALYTDTHEERQRQNLLRHTNSFRNNQEYITHLSEETEGRVTKKISQEFSRTKSRILGAPSKLNQFLPNSTNRVQARTDQGGSRNTNSENHERNEDGSERASSWNGCYIECMIIFISFSTNKIFLQFFLSFSTNKISIQFHFSTVKKPLTLPWFY